MSASVSTTIDIDAGPHAVLGILTDFPAYASTGAALSTDSSAASRSEPHIAEWLDERPNEPLSLVSMCAGQGHDVLVVLSSRPDKRRVRATLIEYDPRNVAAALIGRRRSRHHPNLATALCAVTAPACFTAPASCRRFCTLPTAPPRSAT